MAGFPGIEVNIVDANGNIVTSFGGSSLSNGGGSVAVNADGSVTITALASGTTFVGAVTATTFTGALAGNATTATALQTPRTINGTSFDGSANITVTAAAGTLTGATLAAGVVASSLTSVGILASPHFTSPVVDSGGLTITAGGATVTAGDLAITAGKITFAAAASQIVPGATSMSIRNNGNSSDNLLIVDSGAVTVRNGLTITNGALTMAASTLTGTGLFSKYKNVTTAGWGVPAIYSYNRVATQTNTTVTIINAFAVPAADSSYEIAVNVNVTAVSTTAAMTVTISYTDVANVARVLTVDFNLLTGIGVQAITVAQGTIDYSSAVIFLRCKASTTVTIATAGNVSNITYTAEAMIKQVA